ARGPKHPPGTVTPPPGVDLQTTVTLGQLLYPAVTLNDHAGLFTGRKKTVDDAAGAVRHRKNAAVVLDFQRHATLFEPGHHVAGHEPVEGPQQLLVAARVVADELAGLEAGVGDIAAAAARYLDLGEELRPGLEYDDTSARVRFRISDGPEKSRCAAADDD